MLDPQNYHACVLHAVEDRHFVDDLISRMTNEGFELCTEETLLMGRAANMETVSRLILERCRYIILVNSPDFLRSPAYTLFNHISRTDAFRQMRLKLIPLMYRQCELPGPLAQYHHLHYRMGGELHQRFWERLALVLSVRDDVPDAAAA